MAQEDFQKRKNFRQSKNRDRAREQLGVPSGEMAKRKGAKSSAGAKPGGLRGALQRRRQSRTDRRGDAQKAKRDAKAAKRLEGVKKARKKQFQGDTGIAAGQATANMGAAMSSSGVGAVVGVPMMVAGGGMVIGGGARKIEGKLDEGLAKIGKPKSKEEADLDDQKNIKEASEKAKRQFITMIVAMIMPYVVMFMIIIGFIFLAAMVAIQLKQKFFDFIGL